MSNTLGAVYLIQNRKDISDKFNCTADNIIISVVAIIHNTYRALYRSITWPVTQLQNTTSLFTFMTANVGLEKKDWKHSLCELGPRAVYWLLQVIVKGVAKALTTVNAWCHLLSLKIRRKWGNQCGMELNYTRNHWCNLTPYHRLIRKYNEMKWHN